MNDTNKNDVAKIVAISCSHSPFASVEAQARLLDLLSNQADTITHFVHCGDLLEAAAASVHPGEHDHTLADEFRHASAYLEGHPLGLAGERPVLLAVGEPRRQHLPTRSSTHPGGLAGDDRTRTRLPVPRVPTVDPTPVHEGEARRPLDRTGLLLPRLRRGCDVRRTRGSTGRQLHRRTRASLVRPRSHSSTRPGHASETDAEDPAPVLVRERRNDGSSRTGLGEPCRPLTMGRRRPRRRDQDRPTEPTMLEELGRGTCGTLRGGGEHGEEPRDDAS